MNSPTYNLSCCHFTIGLIFLLQFLLLSYNVNAGGNGTGNCNITNNSNGNHTNHGKVMVNGLLVPRYAAQFMEPQNKAREDLHLDPLQWDVTLRKYAQKYARKRKEDCLLIHSNGPYGENIFKGSGKEWKPIESSVSWVSEKKYYNYTSNSCAQGKDCGHYTQIVWKNTKKVGCARVKCLNHKGIFMTCNYSPRGNYIGMWPY